MTIRKEIARALSKARNIIRRGVLGGGVSSTYTCKVDGAGDDDFDGIEFWQSFGFAARPPVQGEVLVVLPFGGGEGAIVCASHDRAHRPTLAANEVAVYGYKLAAVQAVTYHRANGDIDIVPGAGQPARLGATSGTKFALLGEDFVTKLNALKTALDLLGAAAGPDAAVINGIITALKTFSGSASALQATIAKVK